MNFRSIAILSAVALLSVNARGEEPAALRPVTSSYMLAAGSAHQADTYLTPLKYSGWQTAFRYERLQAMRFSPERWVMRLDLSLNGSRTENPSRNSTMWGATVDASWGMMRRWRLDGLLPAGFSAGIGGSTSLSLGALYNSRNGNNPVAAKAAWTVDVTGYAAWNGRIGRLPLTLRWQSTLPVTGIFFAPDYGELYYEIWLGNHSGLVHPIWWGDWVQWDNLVTADLHLGATSLRLGYAGRMASWRVNHITSRTFTHAFVIGVTTEWLSLRPRQAATPASRIISATY